MVRLTKSSKNMDLGRKFRSKVPGTKGSTKTMFDMEKAGLCLRMVCCTLGITIMGW